MSGRDEEEDLTTARHQPADAGIRAPDRRRLSRTHPARLAAAA
ncbi:MAG: hypothetical protein ABW173_02630 [Sphingomonas sp.]